MILFKLWIFNFDLSSLIAFIVGIVTGFIILGLIYAILVVSSLKSKKYVVKGQEDAISDEEVEELIKFTRKAFKDKNIKDAKGKLLFTYELCFDLVKDISQRFFPKSKRPFAELTIDELLLLLTYISGRIDDILDRPGLRKVKALKLSTILSFTDVKKVVDDSAIMKAGKKYNSLINKTIRTVKSVWNTVNPMNWGKKVISTVAIGFALDKLCGAIISVVGEETYKIYSKKIFDEERSIDTGIEEILVDAENDLSDTTEDDIIEYGKIEKLIEEGETNND